MEWRLEENGTLFLQGEGRIADYPIHGAENAPWLDDKERIQVLILEEGITELGINAFSDCENLKEVFLPESMKRLHYQCFKGCINLKTIHTKEEAEYTFVYEEKKEESKRKKSQKIMFGMNAFYGTPWAVEKWGAFYICDGTLLECFTTEEKIIIPEGIHTIDKFAFSGSNMKDVQFPESLLVIEEFAFENTGLTRILLPKNLQQVKERAFAGTALELVTVSAKSKVDIDVFAFSNTKIKWDGRLKKSRRTNCIYKLNAVKKKEWKDFKPLEVGIKEGAVGKPVLDGGSEILQKIKRGSIILGIRYNAATKMVDFAASVIWNESYKVPKWYQMYPCYRNEETRQGVEIWNDSITEIEENDLESGFYSNHPEKLISQGCIRSVGKDEFEEWFSSGDKYNFAGPIEIQLVEEWLKLHPEYQLQSQEEHRKESSYRWLIGC